MELKSGARLRSVADATEVIVVRPPSGDVDLRCGGHPMVAHGEEAAPAELDAALAEGTKLGKRYHDETTGLEVLCTKAGDGSLSIGDRVVGEKDAKPLPSSD